MATRICVLSGDTVTWRLGCVPTEDTNYVSDPLSHPTAITTANGLCKCPPSFGGVYCQSPKCQNGFPLNTNDFECLCGVKYTGQFCETREIPSSTR